MRARMRDLTVPSPFGRAIAVRGAVVWLGLHGALAAALAMMGRPPSGTFHLGPAEWLWLWGFVVAAVVVDMRARREHLILGNLGVSPRRVVLLVLGLCVVLETVGLLVTTGGARVPAAGG